MKRLFDEKEQWLPEAIDLGNEFGQAIKPILNSWIERGYSVRDIQYVLLSATYDECISKILDIRFDNSKK